jgi:murein DD-endopeptidase
VYTRPSLAETFGLNPLAKALREAAFAVRGDPLTPPSRFDLSSLKILMPRLSIETWLGRTRADGLAPIYNLFNHRQTPPERGWSVRVTQVRDFRGGTLTYDSHNGTDFAVPVGSEVVAAAPGRVFRVSSEFHRGGLKVFIDHGAGLITTSNHLSRALVRPGDEVRRGQPVALSGASGLDMVAAFPWTAPHVHFNVWLNGVNVDPFSTGDEPALWRAGNEPRPAARDDEGEAPPASRWDFDALEQTLAGCRDPRIRAELEGIGPAEQRAANTLFYTNYMPTRFDARPCLYHERYPRQPRLDLPLSGFSGIVIPPTERL